MMNRLLAKHFRYTPGTLQEMLPWFETGKLCAVDTHVHTCFKVNSLSSGLRHCSCALCMLCNSKKASFSFLSECSFECRVYKPSNVLLSVLANLLTPGCRCEEGVVRYYSRTSNEALRLRLALKVVPSDCLCSPTLAKSAGGHNGLSLGLAIEYQPESRDNPLSEPY